MTKLGIGSMLAGFFVGLLAGISSFMSKKTYFSDLTLSGMLGEETSDSIIEITGIEFVENGLFFIFYDLPLFGLLILFGVSLLVLSLFFKNH